MFGLAIDVPHNQYWGARAIYQNCTIDLLADRQSGSNVDESFLKWLNSHALPWLRAKVKEIGLAYNDPQLIVLKQFKYELRACTNASYGYLYIGAVEHTVEECEPHLNPVTGVKERVVKVADEMFIVDDGLVPVGTEGNIKVNNIGPAKVVGYYAEKYGDMKLACLMVEVSSPPKWWVNQTIQRDIQDAVKTGTLPLKRGSKHEPSPKALRQFKKDWKPKPFPIFTNDFKAKEAD